MTSVNVEVSSSYTAYPSKPHHYFGLQNTSSAENEEKKQSHD